MERGVFVVVSLILLIVVGLFFAKFTGLVVTSINTCTDTDIGKDYNTPGEVFGTYYLFNGENFHEKDVCEDEFSLREYYCVSDEGIHHYKEEIVYRCSQGCLNGACLGEEGVEMPQETSMLKRITYFLSRLF